MTTAFPLRPFGEMVDWFDSRRVPVKSADRKPGPYPYYGASGIVDWVDGYLFEGLHLLVSEDGENLRSRSTPIAFLADGKYWVNNHAHVVRGRDDADTRFFGYAMSVTDIAGHVSGSAQPKLSQSSLQAVLLPTPPAAERRAIAEVLGALDDKIAANEKAWRLADDLRRLTFSSGLDDATHVPLSEVARFVNGRPFTKDASGSGRPVIRIAELNSGFGGSTVYNDIEVADDHVARPGDLLFAWSGSLTLRRWYLREGIVNQHIFKVLPAEGWPLWLVASLLERKLDEFKAIAADKATTMGHIQRRHLDDPVSVPTQGWLESNGAKLKSLWDIALAMELESQRLAALRDALLPELMSGRLRVKDVEKTVEEVV